MTMNWNVCIFRIDDKYITNITYLMTVDLRNFVWNWKWWIRYKWRRIVLHMIPAYSIHYFIGRSYGTMKHIQIGSSVWDLGMAVLGHDSMLTYPRRNLWYQFEVSQIHSLFFSFLALELFTHVMKADGLIEQSVDVGQFCREGVEGIK